MENLLILLAVLVFFHTQYVWGVEEAPRITAHALLSPLERRQVQGFAGYLKVGNACKKDWGMISLRISSEIS